MFTIRLQLNFANKKKSIPKEMPCNSYFCAILRFFTAAAVKRHEYAAFAGTGTTGRRKTVRTAPQEKMVES